MLTKTLRFEPPILEVLRNMTWSEDGLTGQLTSQLPRPMYEAVNKAILAMGGKWNRKAAAHQFQTDPRPQVEGLLESGALTVKRDGFFETPEAVVVEMLKDISFERGDRILEPSAGTGAILKHFACPRGDPYYVEAVEKNTYRANKLKEMFPGVEVHNADFLIWDPGYTFAAIIMNPPFEEGQEIDHVRHAYHLLAYKGVMVSVMSEGPFFRADAKAEMFRDWLDTVLAISVQMPTGAFKESGTGVNTRLVFINK